MKGELHQLILDIDFHKLVKFLKKTTAITSIILKFIVLNVQSLLVIKMFEFHCFMYLFLKI